MEPLGSWIMATPGFEVGWRIPMEDRQVLKQIEGLADEEHRLYSKDKLSDDEVKRLGKITVELDQCWDLLRQRRGLRDAGANPDVAKVRPAEVVENYEE
jgi:hypothetical protein